MQAKRYNGSFGEAMRYSPKDLQFLLEKESVESVEVFKATDDEIKEHNKYKVGKRFQKAPRVKRAKP